MPLPSPLPPLCAKPAQRAPLADVLLVVAERGETYEPSDVRWKIANCAGERRRNKMTEANVARPCSSKKKNSTSSPSPPKTESPPTTTGLVPPRRRAGPGVGALGRRRRRRRGKEREDAADVSGRVAAVASLCFFLSRALSVAVFSSSLTFSFYLHLDQTASSSSASAAATS